MTISTEVTRLSKLPLSKNVAEWQRLAKRYGTEAVVKAVMDLQREIVRGREK